MQRFLLAVAALAVTGSLACTTVRTAQNRGGEDVKTETLLPVPASRSLEGDGAVLLAVEFKGLEADDMICRWRVVNQETGKSYFMNVDPADGRAIAQLDAGTYSAGRFGCGIGRVWDLAGTFKEGFKIEQGSVSYLGKIIFEFDADGDLDTIRIAPRAESAAAFIDASQAEDMKEWPAISAFTAKPISGGMVQVGESRDGFDVFATAKTNPVGTLEPLTASLYNCAKEEGLSDPLRFGRLEYLAVYKQGRFAEMKDRKEANGFSDRLRSCVERGMMAFHPDKSSDVEVRVRY